MTSSSGIQFEVRPRPEVWGDLEVHCTLVWAGRKVDDVQLADMVELAQTLGTNYGPIATRIIGEDWLGDGDTHVWQVYQTTTLTWMRDLVVKWIAGGRRVWKPHITAPRQGFQAIGRDPVVHFDAVTVWHKDERMMYPFVAKKRTSEHP